VKSSLHQIIFAPLLIIFGFASLFAFQNCAKEVGFDARPSTERTNNDLSTDAINPNGTGVGGNSNVIIHLNETPASTTVGNGNSVVDYEVITPEGTITDIQCRLDGVIVPCQPTDRIPITNPGTGTHTFTIIATNSNNQTGEEVITWTIYNSIVTQFRDINVTVVADKVDIIINVDNSGSMEYEQSSMASRIASFMEPFKNLDYNIAVTTTSPIGNNTIWKPSLNYVDGKFIELENDVYCIKKSTHTLEQAQTLIRNNVVRDLYLKDDNGNIMINSQTNKPYPEGNGYERGIFTTYRAFERYQQSNSPESRCLRANVAKHVIVISDERETMKDDQGNSFSDVSKSVGANLIAKVGQIFGAQNLFKFHSIIVDPYTAEGQACLDSHGFSPGVEYGQLSRDTGGYIGSVCASDYSSQLGQIGQSISNSALSYTLGCVAVSKDGSLGRVENLPNNGQPVNIPYVFNGNKIEFAQNLPQGNYRVYYNCYQ
jgi:hypothetical protein